MDPLGSHVELAQVLDVASLEDILGSFYALFRIPIRILSDEGQSLARSRKPSPFNDYLRELPGAAQLLGEVHQSLRAGDAGDAGEFSQTTFSGASYHVAMIGHEGRRIGRFILGPFITPDVRDVSKTLLECDPRVDAARARELLLALPRVREDTIRAIARHLAVTLDVLIFAGHKALLTEYMHLSTVQENQRQLSLQREGLEAAEIRLVETRRARSDFLATVLGELHSPLRAIMEDSERLTKNTSGGCDPAELATSIREKAELLVRLAHRVVEFSHVENGALVLHQEGVDPRALLERTCTGLQSIAPDRAPDLRVQCDEDVPWLWADVTHLGPVLMLLGENALRFAPEGPIRLEARCIPEPSAPGDEDSEGLVLLGSPRSVVELRISDAGQGVPDSEKERVFEPFYRGITQAERGGAGSGLGLAIAKRVIEAHQGKIWVENHRPRGAVFVITLAPAPPN